MSEDIVENSIDRLLEGTAQSLCVDQMLKCYDRGQDPFEIKIAANLADS